MQRRSPLSRLRALRDADAADGFSRELWDEMARLGWLGIVVPEQYGGAGLGWTDLMVVLEELGRGLVPEPMMGTVLLGATTLLLGGSEAQRSAHLPAVVAGEQCLALAYQEPASRYAHQHVETRAERSGDGWTLGGQKVHVLDGQCADWFIVSARTAARATRQVSRFSWCRGMPALGIERQHCVDARGAALCVWTVPRVDAGALSAGKGTDRRSSSVSSTVPRSRSPPRCSAGWPRASR